MRLRLASALAGLIVTTLAGPAAAADNPPPGDPCSGSIDTNCWYYEDVWGAGDMWVYCGLWVSGSCVYGAALPLLAHLADTALHGVHVTGLSLAETV